MADLTLKGFRDKEAIEAFLIWLMDSGGTDNFAEYLDYRGENHLFSNIGGNRVYDEDGNGVADVEFYDEE